MELGRAVAADVAGLEVHEDAQHWAFVAMATTELPDMPNLFLVAQYGKLCNGPGGSVQTVLCTSDAECTFAMKRFVRSPSDSATQGSARDIEGSITLKVLVDKAIKWRATPYNLFA